MEWRKCNRCKKLAEDAVQFGPKTTNVYCQTCTCSECGVELEAYEEVTCEACCDKHENARLMEKRKRGRPATSRGPYNPVPCRSLGRVDDDTWQALKQAAADSGKPFSEWAVETLLKAATRKAKR